MDNDIASVLNNLVVVQASLQQEISKLKNLQIKGTASQDASVSKARLRQWVTIPTDIQNFDPEAEYRVKLAWGFFYATTVDTNSLTIRISQHDQLGVILSTDKTTWVAYNKGEWGKVQNGPHPVVAIQMRNYFSEIEPQRNFWKITVYHSHGNQTYNYSTFCMVDSNGSLVLDFWATNSERHYGWNSGTKEEIRVKLWNGSVLPIKLQQNYVCLFKDSWDSRFSVEACSYEVVKAQ